MQFTCRLFNFNIIYVGSEAPVGGLRLQGYSPHMYFHDCLLFVCSSLPLSLFFFFFSTISTPLALSRVYACVCAFMSTAFSSLPKAQLKWVSLQKAIHVQSQSLTHFKVQHIKKKDNKLLCFISANKMTINGGCYSG